MEIPPNHNHNDDDNNNGGESPSFPSSSSSSSSNNNNNNINMDNTTPTATTTTTPTTLPHHPKPTTTTTTNNSNINRAAFQQKLDQMRLTLAPLVQLTSGEIHSAFPSTLLSFWLLTDQQLEQLASFYHQRTPCPWTSRYPCPVSWPREGLSVEDKRRKIGRFIGLRGCESPVVRAYLKTEEEIAEDARRARLAEEEEVRRKMRWY